MSPTWELMDKIGIVVGLFLFGIELIQWYLIWKVSEDVEDVQEDIDDIQEDVEDIEESFTR